MKNIIALILIIAIAAGAWLMYGDTLESGSSSTASLSNQSSSSSQDGSASVSGDPSSSANDNFDPDEEEEEDFDEDFDDRPAAEIYKSAKQALAAVKSGAEDYDDLVLEQFTTPGEDCTWCPEFYQNVTSEMFSADSSEDEKSYYAEVLAISGKVEHISTLVQAVQDAGASDEADIFAEALELTIGGDDVVDTLSKHIKSENELLAEASVAAITNQGSRKAAEILYQHTVDLGDADGFYSLGIGLAELIPEEETLPYLNELVTKRDQYSHLAVKGLLNYGMDGLKVVMESLRDEKFDKDMLEDAVDHVSYEEPVEEYLKKLIKTSKNPLATQFAKDILKDFDVEFEE